MNRRHHRYEINDIFVNISKIIIIAFKKRSQSLKSRMVLWRTIVELTNSKTVFKNRLWRWIVLAFILVSYFSISLRLISSHPLRVSLRPFSLAPLSKVSIATVEGAQCRRWSFLSEKKVIGYILVMILRVFLQPPKKKVPCTIKNTRELNETVCKPDDDEVLNFYY